jgi:RimJ/RimL family protein N-acetyltransferase
MAFPAARDLVLDTYRGFSTRIGDVAARFFDERWIDAPERKGKRNGAFSASTVPSVHPYVMLNYTGKRRDALVLAIELDGRHVGNISLQDIDPVGRSADLAIVLDRSVWGDGVGSEAAELLVAHGFSALNLHRITCGTVAANHGMRRLAERLGMTPFEIDDEGRAAYHAAASVASNFLVTLQAAAETIAAGAGLGRDEARALLAPLVRQTVENIAELGPEDALTGPVARGDDATVATQRAAVEEVAPELVDLFDELVQRTRDLAAPRATA